MLTRANGEDFMRGFAKIAIVLGAAALSQLPATQVKAQQFATPGAWLERLDREHHNMVSPAGHVHAKGVVEAVDAGGIITLWHTEISNKEKTIWMPPMRMTFHVINRRMLRDISPGDVVQFEAARLRNAVMITKLRKAR
jgi:Cu/Ag efflux protein CusF